MRTPLDPGLRLFALKVLICLVLAAAAAGFQFVFLPAPIPIVVPAILLAGGLFLGFFEESPLAVRQGAWIKRGVGLGLIALSVWAGRPGPPEAEMSWQPYSVEAVTRAQQDKKPVLIYFHADWCGPCRVLEQGPLSRRVVVDAARRFVALRADMTDPQLATTRAVAEKYGIMAYPTIVFVGADGVERQQLRVLGVESVQRLVGRLDAVQ